MPKSINRVGETNKANNGLLMTIIECNNNRDLTIRFEDGVIVKHKSYANFLSGNISHPSINMHVKVNHIGETRTLPDGLTLTVTGYRRCDDVDILRSDGVLLEHVDYKKFSRARGGRTKGYLHIGETSTAVNGMVMTIIAYRTNKDIDVQFEDGFVVEHVKYINFKNGQIGHPNSYRLRPSIIKKNAESRIGMTNYNKAGLLMTIIAYRNNKDIDVQFEDGTIVQHRHFAEFSNGNIGHPQYQARSMRTRQKYVGKVFYTRIGLAVSIVEYRGSHDLDILFETGYRKTIAQASDLVSGRIKHPFPYQIGLVNVNKPAYVYNGVGNFYCRCSKCCATDIMSIQEIKNHTCK